MDCRRYPSTIQSYWQRLPQGPLQWHHLCCSWSVGLEEEALGRCLAQPSGTTCFELFACLLEDDVNLNASQVNSFYIFWMFDEDDGLYFAGCVFLVWSSLILLKFLSPVYSCPRNSHWELPLSEPPDRQDQIIQIQIKAKSSHQHSVSSPTMSSTTPAMSSTTLSVS